MRGLPVGISTPDAPRLPFSELSLTAHRRLYDLLNVSKERPLPLLRSKVRHHHLSINKFCQLGLAPSTASDYQRAMSHFLTVVPPPPSSSSSTTSLFSATRVLKYLEILINLPTWKSLGSVKTRTKQILAVAALSGSSNLSQHPQIKRFLKSLARLEKFDVPRQAVPAVRDQVVTLVSKLQTTNLQMAAILALMWLGAFRLGDVMRAPMSSLRLSQHPPTIQLRWMKTETMARGKFILSRQSPLFQVLQRYYERIKSRRSRSLLLFSLSISQVRYFLKTNTPWTGHSFRRGALQCLADAGTPVDVLLKISGHSSEKMLLRYLRVPPKSTAERVAGAMGAAL